MWFLRLGVGRGTGDGDVGEGGLWNMTYFSQLLGASMVKRSIVISPSEVSRITDMMGARSGY